VHYIPCTPHNFYQFFTIVREYPECHGVLEISTPKVEPRGIHFGNIVFQGCYLT
jgi:hypothetical protein